MARRVAVMYAAGVDFRVPLVSQATFTSAIADHTRAVIAQLASATTRSSGSKHAATSAHAEQDVATMVRTMTQYSVKHLQSLDDLHAFLHTLCRTVHERRAHHGAMSTRVNDNDNDGDGVDDECGSCVDDASVKSTSAATAATATTLPRVVQTTFRTCADAATASPHDDDGVKAHTHARHDDDDATTTTRTSTTAAAAAAGWVCLLVCTQQMLLCLLHELSAVQGGLAWRAWYWSWAQQHSAHAALHLTLASAHVCVRWLRHGATRTLRDLRAVTQAHMRALQTLFGELVGCIGASYTVLDTLNTSVTSMLQQEQQQQLLQQPCVRTGDVATGADARDRGGRDDDVAAAQQQQQQQLGTAVRHAVDTLAPLLRLPPSMSTRSKSNVGGSRRSTSRVALLVPADAASTHDAVAAQPSHSTRSDDNNDNNDDDNDDDAGEEARALCGSVVALHECVRRCIVYVATLTHRVHTTHAPPPTRHAGRLLAAALVLAPAMWWLSRHGVVQLYTMAQRVCALAVRLGRSYVTWPLAQLKQSLLFARPHAQAQRDAFERDACALADIIADYYRDHSPRAASLTPEALQAVRAHTLACLRSGAPDDEGYGLVLAHYRHHVQRPLLSSAFGQLPRVLLIQMSHQALDISRVTNSIDDILASNDLNFRILAMAPVLLAGGVGVLWSLLHWRATQQPVRRQLRRVWRALHRVVSAMPGLATATASSVAIAPCAAASSAAAVAERVPPSPQLARAAATASMTWQHTPAMTATATASFDEAAAAAAIDSCACAGRMGEHNAATSMTAALSNYEQGVLLLLVHVLRATVVQHLRAYAFAPELLEDLHDLERARGTRQHRLLILQRMYMTHSVFR